MEMTATFTVKEFAFCLPHVNFQLRQQHQQVQAKQHLNSLLVRINLYHV